VLAPVLRECHPDKFGRGEAISRPPQVEPHLFDKLEPLLGIPQLLVRSSRS